MTTHTLGTTPALDDPPRNTTTWHELDPPAPSFWRILRLETWSELLKMWRLPMYTLPTLLFPLMFYFFFAVILPTQSVGNVTMGTYLIATYGTFGVLGACLFGLGVGLASERGQGWMLFKRATPMPPLVHVLARIAIAMLFSLAVVVELFLAGVLVAGVRPSIEMVLSITGILVAGSIPFTAIGIALGYLCKPNSAPAVINIIYLPISIVSGLWIPIQMMPDWLQQLAHFAPPFHLAQLALARLGIEPLVSPLISVGALVLTTVIFIAVAVFAYRRDDGATFG